MHRQLALPGVVAVLLVVTVVVDARTPGTGPGVALAPGDGWPYAALGAFYAGLGAVVLGHAPGHRFGRALAWLGLFWAIDGLAQTWVRFAIRDDEVLPGANLALWVLNRAGALLPLTIVLLLLLFPTGRFLPGRWGTTSRAVVGTTALAALVVVVAPATGTGVPRLPPGVDLDAGAVLMPDSLAGPLFTTARVVTVAGVVLAMASVLVRLRLADAAERARLRWLQWAVAVMAVVLALDVAAGLGDAGGAVVVLLAGLPPLAMVVGVVRPDVVPVDDLLAVTVGYGLLTVGLVAVDLVALSALAALLGDRLDQRQTVVVALLLTALVYVPLRQRWADAVRGLAFGARGRRYDVVAGLASRLESEPEGPAQLAAVTDAVAEAFGVAFVSVEVDRGDGEQVVAVRGTRPARVRTLPIVYRGERVGRVVLPASGWRSRLSRRDDRLLSDLVRQAATAARTALLAEELQRARERLVLAREEERRRIRRDLHDGLGPSLGGVVFTLESARLLLQRDPSAAAERIAATRDLVQETVADVRRLVHDLRPPALDDRGLVEALRQQLDRVGPDGPVTGLSVDPPDAAAGLPAAVEVAAYRIAGEALTNVVRHAGAARCEVRLTRTENALTVQVEDDGRGIAAGAVSGIGLLSLRERAAELGGTTRVTSSAGGGTVVRAVLPLLPATTRTAERP